MVSGLMPIKILAGVKSLSFAGALAICRALTVTGLPVRSLEDDVSVSDRI